MDVTPTSKTEHVINKKLYNQKNKYINYLNQTL